MALIMTESEPPGTNHLLRVARDCFAVVVVFGVEPAGYERNNTDADRCTAAMLVADDATAIQLLVTRAIDQLGLVVLPVSDGAAAIMAVAARRADLICAVLDITMPLVSGVNAARVIRRLASDLAIVLMSGQILADYAVHINQLRFAGLLDQPFPLAALRELIRHAIGDGAAIEVA